MRFENGWVRLDRRTLFGDIGQEPNTLLVWMWLLGLANVKQSTIRFQGKQTELPPGSLVTGLEELASFTKLTSSSIRRALQYLEMTGRIRQTVGNRGRLITICKWDEYQNAHHEDDKLATSKRKSGESLATSQRHLIEQETIQQSISTVLERGPVDDEKKPIYFNNADELLAAVSERTRNSWRDLYPDEIFIRREAIRALEYYLNNRPKLPRTMAGWSRKLNAWFEKSWNGRRHQQQTLNLNPYRGGTEFARIVPD